MYVKPFLLAAGLLAVAGCAGNVTIPRPGPDHPANPLAASAPPPASPAIPEAENDIAKGMPEMDHGSMQGMQDMDHGSMEGMGHGPMKSMDQESMRGMNHGSMRGMDQGTMKDAPKPGATEESKNKKDMDGMGDLHDEH